MPSRRNWQRRDFGAYQTIRLSSTALTLAAAQCWRTVLLVDSASAGDSVTVTLPTASRKNEGSHLRIINGTSKSTSPKLVTAYTAAGFANSSTNFVAARVQPGEFADYTIQLIGNTAAWYANNSSGLSTT